MEKTKQQIKRKNWKIAKGKILSKIPIQFKIETSDIDSESEYYHVKILIDDTMYISAQGDANRDYVYGYYLNLNTDLEINECLHKTQISLNDDDKLFYVLNNIGKIHLNLLETLNEIRKLTELKYSIELIQSNMIWNCIEEIIDKSKIKNSLDMIYEVSEYLENKRLTN